MIFAIFDVHVAVNEYINSSLFSIYIRFYCSLFYSISAVFRLLLFMPVIGFIF